VSFDIPAEPLSEAILAFSRQSDIIVTAPFGLVDGKQAPAINGQMTPERALKRLLEGSGLVAVAGRDGALIVQAERSSLRKNTSAPATRGAEAPTPRPIRTAATGVSQIEAVASRGEKTQPSIEEITVTGTRITREGYAAPTPTTVLSQADLQLFDY